MLPEVNLNTRRCRSIIKSYNSHNKRPHKTPNYVNNWALLRDGWDIIWPGILMEIKDNIGKENWEMIRILLKADLRGMKLRIRLDTPREIVDLMPKSGLEVTLSGPSSEVTLELAKELMNLGIKLDLFPRPSNLDNLPKIRELIEIGVKVTWTYVNLAIPKETIDQFRDAGVEVTLRPLNPNDYVKIEEVINVVDNLTEDPIILDISKSVAISEYLELIRRPFTIRNRISYIMSSYRFLLREFDTLDEQEKDDIFQRSCHSNRYDYLRYIFDNGYRPNLDTLDVKPSWVAVMLLESPHFSEDEKWRFFRRLSTLPSNINFRLHPSTHKYWIAIKGENHRDDLADEIRRRSRGYNEMECHVISYDVDKIREYIASGKEYSCHYTHENYIILLLAYDVLSQEQRERYFSKIVNNGGMSWDSTNPIFRDLWSTVPTNNSEFLWFLYCNEIPLPPADQHSGKSRLHTGRLIQRHDKDEVIYTLVKGNHDFILLQFLNESKINVRGLMGRHPKLDLLAERCPTRVKPAMKK